MRGALSQVACDILNTGVAVHSELVRKSFERHRQVSECSPQTRMFLVGAIPKHAWELGALTDLTYLANPT